jgi:signal transduction histidine kinase/ligand-binding sensor domain-containing protein/DNA-binding response OmpR family regulator
MKKNVKFIGKAVLLLLLLCNQSYGQQILFRNYSVIDGLCSNTVWSISQDDKGFMWFGTKNGLNRFDGYQFKSYQFNKEDKHSIGNNFIHTICKYDSKNYWIGTEDGIYILNLENEKFTHFPLAENNLVFDIFRDSKGIMWIATKNNGLYGYQPTDKKTMHFTAEAHNPNTISLNQVRKIAEDGLGRIWIGTFGEGVDVLDPASMKFTHYKMEVKEGNLNSNKIISIYKDLQGNMWTGTLGGLNVWVNNTDSFKTYRKGGVGSLNDNIVRAIYQPSPDKLYVGTEKGLNVLSIENQTFTAYTNKTNDPHSISDNAIYSIYPDKEGGIWLGTFFGGLNYFAKKGSNFELYYATGEKNSLSGNAVSCFLEDKPGYFWIGTENAGLNYFDSHTKTFKTYPFNSSQQPLSYHNIHCLFKDDKQNIWIGTFSAGLNIYSPSTGRVKKYQHNPLDSNSISSNNIYSIYKDKDGAIWVGTTEGLNVYDPQKDCFHRIYEMDLQQTLLYNIYEDDNNNIWFITYDNGLIGKNKKTNKWVKYSVNGEPNSISSNKIISVFDDHAGNLWLGTEGGGLNCFNINNKTFKVFNEQHGVSPIVYGILQDDKGELWLSSNNGIIKFSPRTQNTRRYTNLDNLQSNQFNYNAALKASDGKMYFGGINGFNAFYPDSIKNVVLSSYVSLTNFQLFNKDVIVDSEGSPLNKMIGFKDRITLSHNQSVISFEYAALSYLAPEKIQYAYIMDGFDKNWNYVGNQRKATYTNLPPGTYTFKVKSTDIYGNWNEKPAEIKVVVRPPFYLTTIAKILYLLLFVAGIVAFRNFSIRQARKKNEVKLERLKNQREQEFYTQKIEFFTTMAHEIRTPLSLIIAPLEKLMNAEKWKPEIKEQLTIMDENADRLLNLVNQLLDFRRIESDIYTIRTEEVELISFVQSLYSRFSAISYQKGIKFSMVTNFNQLVVQADPEAMTKILTNLLINAFKFTRNKVEIRINEIVKGEDDKQFFSVSVMDDGIGIPETQLENIFKAFFKVDSGSHQYSNVGGTGIGLALAKSLTEKHNGQLLVESKEGVQTIFTVMIPYEMPAVMVAENGINNPAVSDGAQDDKPVILVVEDDASLLEFISKNLKAENYKSIRATNGVEALNMLETNSVDLIISDVMMPEMDGIEFCKQVKSNVNYSHIPLILLTAKGNSDAEIAGIENGADAYMMKPFKWKHVTVVIKNLLESRVRLKNKFTQQPFAAVDTLTTNTHDKKFVEKLISIIEERITDPQLSVEELSREMAMSRSSLHKKLKAMSGHVPNEFIRLIRLKNAAKMLLSGEHNISEVGYMTGFNSPSYFSRCFMQQFSVTPSEFAEKHHSKKITDYKKMI